MVSGSRMEGGIHTLPLRVRKTIQSIKEIVGNHSDADIYLALKESNMDPNETAQKLLNQDPFHEVRRKRDKKKENIDREGSADQRKQSHNPGEGISGRNVRTGGYTCNAVIGENLGQGMAFSGRTIRTGDYTRNRINREFRVVRDNRVNQDTVREKKPISPKHTISIDDQVRLNACEKGPMGSFNNHKPIGGQDSSRDFKRPGDSRPRHARDANAGVSNRRVVLDEKQVTVSHAVSPALPEKPSNFQQHPLTSASNSSVGLYTSTDPVHVPSPDSRSLSSIGAIKREVGVVGVRRQSPVNSVKTSSVPIACVSDSNFARDSSSESSQPLISISKADQNNQTTATGSIAQNVPAIRSSSSNHHASRSHQHAAGHQKAPQPSKEWRPKSSQKPSAVLANNLKDFETEATKLQDKFSQVHIQENQNVIIAEHIRVPETDRCQLTFGSLSLELDSSLKFSSGRASEELNGESTSSLSVSTAESLGEDAPSSKQIDLEDNHVRNAESDCQESGAMFERQVPDKKDVSIPQTLGRYGDIGLVQDTSPSDTTLESQQQHFPHEIPKFSAYDPQGGYGIPYFRSTVDESMQGQALPSLQEALNSRTSNNIAASPIAMVQQQQQQQPQVALYPQVQVSHFPNFMPYRQIFSQVYLPQIALPGYSSTPAYPHPSNGNSFMLMPGGNSHLSASSVKYGPQQYKPVPAGSPTGFGNFASPNGYAVNASGAIRNAGGLEDSSRMKYKDGNHYVPNPQAETSEVWIHNPREIPGMQASPYYSMTAQTPHVYMPSHGGHAPLNTAAAQSSHMQYPGMYHPPLLPGAITNPPHHIGPVMNANIGVGMSAAAPGAQVAANQQPQLSNLNWTPNF